MLNFINQQRAVADLHRIGAIGSRLQPLTRSLRGFEFSLVAHPMAGLLTRPENHAATTRIEALIHLAAAACRGIHAPSLGRLREWMNVFMLDDIVALMEDPVEDVVVSNVIAPFGNARLFEGAWRDNDYAVQDCLTALSSLRSRRWATTAQRHVTALLQVSEAVADRAQIPRNTLAQGLPRQPVEISSSTVEESRPNVIFSHADIKAIGVRLEDLGPFFSRPEHFAALATETLRHSSLERRPLIHFRDQTIVALPTAIGAAICRFVIEQAIQAQDLAALESAIIEQQVSTICSLGCRAWEIQELKWPPSPTSQPTLVEAVGMFDRHSPAHIVYIPDSLSETASDGLHAGRAFDEEVDRTISAVSVSLTTGGDYRRGLTIVVHGGLGRPFSGDLGELPADWHILALSFADFLRMAWDRELTALRAWKLLEQERVLESRGTVIVNYSGFPNYYAYLSNHDFNIIAEEFSSDNNVIPLPTDSVKHLRHTLRESLDSHAALAPDGKSWIPVQRMTTNPVLREDDNLPIFISARHASEAVWLGCVEVSGHPWWVSCSERPESDWHGRLVHMVWNMTLNWLLRLAEIVAEKLPSGPGRPIVYQLRFPRIHEFTTEYPKGATEHPPPAVRVARDHVSIDCHPEYLRNFAGTDNVAERLMVAAMLRGAYRWFGRPLPEEAEISAIVHGIVGSREARFVAMTPTITPERAIYGAVSIPKPRFPGAEDLAWSCLDLARRAGWTEPAGPVPRSSAKGLLGRAVDTLWKEVRTRLLELDRRNLVERSLLNFAAIQRERLEWDTFSPAMFTMSADEVDLLRANDVREARRALAAVASRVIAEMAVCTSPATGGGICTDVDLDYLIADMATLLGCAVQSDAMYHGLSREDLVVRPNGSFGFDSAILATVYPYMTSLRERAFRDAADRPRSAAESPHESGLDDPGFNNAFVAEFGLSLEQYGEFAVRTADELVHRRVPFSWLPRSEVLRRLAEVGAAEPERTLAALVLLPRPKWDEDDPIGAMRRDWYPWRFGRRLSVLRRPLVQLTTGLDPEVLIMPTLLAANQRYLLEARSGRLPESLFDSAEMRAWIGDAANRHGHAFNHKVAGRLKELGWSVRAELMMTELGGGSELGDIDVLAWHPDTGPIYAIECKRLMFDRTVGEIGERLNDYKASSRDGQRTPIQKHLDRLTFLKEKRVELGGLTGIPDTLVQSRSALVTDYLTPMQFSEDVKGELDVVVDYRHLESTFGSI